MKRFFILGIINIITGTILFIFAALILYVFFRMRVLSLELNIERAPTDFIVQFLFLLFLIFLNYYAAFLLIIKKLHTKKYVFISLFAILIFVFLAPVVVAFMTSSLINPVYDVLGK